MAKPVINRCKQLALATLLTVHGATLAWAQALPPELASVWGASRLPQSALSIVVDEAEGPRLIGVNPQEPRNPASVMKLVSTWAGLSALGPEYTWRTTLMAQGGLQVDAQGTLKGPLYIKAGGDPFLTVPQLWDMLRELRLRGVKNLTEVVVDRSIFGNVAINPGDFDNAGDRPYNASPDAMMVGLGASRLVFQPDQQARKWIAIVDPPLPGVRVQGELEWSTAACPGSPAVGTQIAAQGTEIVIRVSGKAAASCGEFSVYRLVHSQTEFFDKLFRSLWRDLGGTLARDIRSGRVPGNAQAITWHDSRSLSDLIRIVNKQSNNVMARTVLLTVGAETSGQGATVASGERAVMAILNRQGVDTRGWVVDNGSGLSRNGRITAGGMADMLKVAWRSNWMPEYISSFAISGVDGTVRGRLRDDEVQGRAHLKTGTLRDSRALAGYVLGASGKRYIVVMMVNDERSASARPFFDAVIKWLAVR
ncbi:MAG TPA: D-alanyl-D-alanine carboxypeptidase/D-alanyl-D-alanine-endopeptidase [Alcaligenes sp.]|nr:D-alanyl-D-alanine carboxypeptidase/D-alanyl-D-alanine-endopeptidase [Alcaligenes sp.]HRL27748.1 D-alanyl-D-alanine carboxypeptidase/D-alanyl-D-alanine-endopeptidase [Alcaligenes sp.]